jgi:hypothetical protein
VIAGPRNARSRFGHWTIALTACAWASRMSRAAARPRLRRNTLGQRVDGLLEFGVFLEQCLDLIDGVQLGCGRRC